MAEARFTDGGPNSGTLWEAFRAGFEASGEGWNGEYPEEFPEGQVRQDFEAWTASKGVV